MEKEILVKLAEALENLGFVIRKLEEKGGPIDLTIGPVRQK
jgi:hypothetical protein